MSDSTKPPEPAEPVRVALDLPAGLVRDYDALVEDDIYPNRESALLHAIVESWRHNRGSFHRVRVDLDCREKPQGEGTEPAPNSSREAPEG
jgi:hypothetical protein